MRARAGACESGLAKVPKVPTGGQDLDFKCFFHGNPYSCRVNPYKRIFEILFWNQQVKPIDFQVYGFPLFSTKSFNVEAFFPTTIPSPLRGWTFTIDSLADFGRF